ncbi:MAG: HU family DNA-binding protein [Bacteroides sp.]|nr:HU family DNA-binding protein [Bacteroides sp.]
MAILFKAFQSPLKNKKGNKLFYPKVVRTGNVSTNKIAEEIAGRSSLSTGDVKNTLDNLGVVMSRYLQTSHSVTLDGLGTFRTVMISKGKGVENAEDVSASQSTLTVRFKPSFKKNPSGKLATRSMVENAEFEKFESKTATKPKENVGGESSDNDL